MAYRSYSALPDLLKRSVHAIALATLLSGIAWLALKYAAPGRITEEIGRRAQTSLLKIHGAAAMLALVALGALLSAHILPGLGTPQNRRAGITLLTGTVTLALTGWCLYYLGDESLRAWASDIHIAIGIAVTAAFVYHIGYRKRSAKRSTRKAGYAASKEPR